MNNLANIPFKQVNIYEYVNQDTHEYENRESQSISFSKNENQLVGSSISYQVKKSNVNHFSFKIKPLYDIDYIITLINIEEEESFNLIDGVSKNISNLKKGIIYNFKIENIRKLDTAIIKITLDNFYKEALTKIDIIESHYDKTYFNSESQSISFSNQNKKLVSTNSYTISNDLTSVLLLKITLNWDIEIFNILIEIQKGEFDILRDKEKCINLKAKQKYHFYRPSFRHKSYDYTLTVNYMRNQPFKFINIYECRPFFTDCSSKKYQEIKFKLKRGELVSSFNYKPGDKSNFYTYIEISPDYDIDYIIPECEYHDIDDINKKTIIILSIIGSCIFIAIVIVLIICIRKRKNSKNSNLIENSSKEPLYPNNNI